jgi:hypothetical protein
MSEHEFIIWLTGFVEASNEYNITPKQFDSIKEQLKKVTQKDRYICDCKKPAPYPQTQITKQQLND